MAGLIDVCVLVAAHRGDHPHSQIEHAPHLLDLHVSTASDQAEERRNRDEKRLKPVQHRLYRHL